LSMKAKAEARTPKECRKCGLWNEVKEKIRISNLLEKTIKAFEKRIDTPDFKPTIAEYLKLVQLEQESEQETPKEIKVTWIDPAVMSNSEK
jgi:hypothetical protein